MFFENLVNNLKYIGSSIVTAGYDLNYQIKMAESDSRYDRRMKKENHTIKDMKNCIVGECGWQFSGTDPQWLLFGSNDNSSVIKSGWMEQLEFLSKFITDSIAMDTKGNLSDLDVERVKKFLDVISDPETQDEIIDFDRRHRDETSMLSLIVSVSGILYRSYPNYEDMYIDKEKQLSEHNRKYGDTRKLMVSLPRDISNILDVTIGMPLMTRPEPDGDSSQNPNPSSGNGNMDIPLVTSSGAVVKPGEAIAPNPA